MLARLFPDRFVPVLFATILLASLLPVRGGAVPIAQGVSTAAIVFLFFLNGVRLPRDEVLHGIRNWKLQGSALAFCFGVMAALGLAAQFVTAPLLPATLALGFLFLGILPSTVQSATAASSLAGGNVAASVVAAALLNLVGVAASPLLFAALAGAEGEIHGEAVLRIVAILLLLARLGLRAGEAALIALDDIDWRAGLLRVKGKGGRIASIPLPHDVGEAISDYILRGRPLSGSRTIFHRVETPYTPFRSASMVSLIAGRALRRAGITGLRSRYAHVFRHTFATIAIRSGASLTELGQVLGHKDPNTTRIYAKVDIEGLRSLSRAWMGAAL